MKLKLTRKRPKNKKKLKYQELMYTFLMTPMMCRCLIWNQLLNPCKENNMHCNFYKYLKIK